MQETALVLVLSPVHSSRFVLKANSKQYNSRQLNCVNEVQPNSDSGDTLEEDSP